MTRQSKFLQIFNDFCETENGATAIEYGLIAALIAIAIIPGVRLVGQLTDRNMDCLWNLSQARFADDGKGPCQGFEKNGR